ncbi:AAA family ATPase, partial [Cylindrospermopsis raciborskii CS-506_A]|nr:AAA family ATPase [Cylindrospermopsis raciborskii CS-506_A]
TRAVVLVDEYDKPILDNIDNPNIAAEMREGLKNLYSVLKGQDANLQFVFMTGVTKFSKVSLFSG